MRNGYILLTEALLSLTKSRGRIQQVETKIVRDGKAHHLAAVNELTDVRAKLNEMADMLVEVQGLMPEPTKGDIVRHYNPDAVDVKPLVLDPEAFLGVPGPGKTVYFTADSEQGIVGDGRPAGWTEALALEFLSDGTDGPEEFAKSFLHGDWPTIQKEWPEFQTFINKQLEGGEEVVDEEPAKPEHYDQWISSECMMLLKGLNLIDKAGLIELDLPRDKLDLMGRILEDQRKRLTDSLAKKLDKVVLPHVE